MLEKTRDLSMHFSMLCRKSNFNIFNIISSFLKKHILAKPLAFQDSKDQFKFILFLKDLKKNYIIPGQYIGRNSRFFQSRLVDMNQEWKIQTSSS